LKRSWAAGVALALTLAACVRLPEIGDDECGNGVIEPPEDCDTFGVDGGALCRPKGALGECHLDCSSTGRDACPTGWGCDLAGICRRPTGGFTAAREFEVGTAATLASADFDGDGRADVLSAEPLDSYGVTRIKFHYFDEEGELSDTRPFPHLLLAPTLARMNDDARADVVFTDERVGLLLGRTDRSWVPETFSSYRFPDTAIRTLTVRDALIEDTSGFVVFARFEGVDGVYVPDPTNNGVPRRLGALPAPVERFVGDPVAAQVIEGAPCAQALVAIQGDTHFGLYDMCTLGPDNGSLWRPEMTVVDVALDPPQPIDHGPLAADVNGDGHIDVLVGSGDSTFVAYGDGATLATAVPFTLTMPGAPAPEPSVPMPLAAGDVTGDGVTDFVFPTGMLMSQPSSLGQSLYSSGAAGQQAWTSAVIADLNANGFPDVLIGSSERPGLTFFNGTGTPDVIYFSIPTSRPVQRLVTGDFDGNSIEDVAFTQDNGNQAEVNVMMAFGAPFGAPLPGVAVARLPNVEQMMQYRQARVSNLLISSSEASDKNRRGVLTLLTGSTDRIPVALYELNTFAADSSVDASLAVRAVGGAFTSPTPGEVLSIGSPDVPMDATLEFWLLPAPVMSPGAPGRDGQLGPPTLLAGALPADVHPATGAGGLTLAAAAADLDGDGRDEALLAMPGADAEHCALLAYEVDVDRVTLRSEVQVPEPCARTEIAAVHADDDGRLDVVWLTGRADGIDRSLAIVWNDGAGQLSADLRSVIAERAVSPQAFALLENRGQRGTSMVYATRFGLERVAITPTRDLGEPETLAPLESCTGLTAADVDGDGAVDLVAAAGGNLHVLKAGLETL